MKLNKKLACGSYSCSRKELLNEKTFVLQCKLTERCVVCENVLQEHYYALLRCKSYLSCKEYRLHWNFICGGIAIYVNKNIPAAIRELLD